MEFTVHERETDIIPPDIIPPGQKPPGQIPPTLGRYPPPLKIT